MSLKDFLIGAGTAIVGVAIGAAIVCCCNNSCEKSDKNCDVKNGCEKQMNHHRQRDGQGPDCYRHGQKSKIVKELQLSEEQKTKVDALQKTKREAALAEREKYEKDFVNILTDEQKAKYNEIISTFGQKKCPKEQTPEVEE